MVHSGSWAVIHPCMKANGSNSGIPLYLLCYSIEQILADLDAFREQHNTPRTKQGRYCQGRTPFQTLLEGLDPFQKHVYGGIENGEAAP